MLETIRDVINQGLLKINPIKTIASLGVIGMMAYLCYALVKIEIPPNNREPLLIILGIISTTVSNIIGYYFGSSAGSKNKDEIIKQMNQK